MKDVIQLKGMGWDHDRCMSPLLGSIEAFKKTNPNVEISWDTRSLADFGEGRLEELLADYDLIVFDHPYCGEISKKNWMLPMQQFLTAGQTAKYKLDSLGPSWDSYQAAGQTWALPIDAAAQVSVYRPDLLESLGVSSPPQNIQQVIELGRLARTKGMWICLPSVAIDLICTFLTLTANSGTPVSRDGSFFPDRDKSIEVLNTIKSLIEVSHPDSLSWNPIHCFNYMQEHDDVCYVPYAFGYTNYSRNNGNKAIQFCDIPGLHENSCAGALIGGAGIGISSSSKHPEQAFEYANFLCSAEYQAGEYFNNGGQPASLHAWSHAETNNKSMNFFSRTLSTLENSYLRPNFSGYIAHFRSAGAEMHDCFTNNGDIGELADWLAKDYFNALKNG